MPNIKQPVDYEIEYEFEKLNFGNDHTITSKNTLHDKDNGRVVAVFYNDYDLDNVIKKLDESSQVKYLKEQIKNLEYQLWESIT